MAEVIFQKVTQIEFLKNVYWDIYVSTRIQSVKGFGNICFVLKIYRSEHFPSKRLIGRTINKTQMKLLKIK